MNKQRLIIVVGAGLGMLATFLPWASTAFASINGTHGGDGWFTFAFFLVSMVFGLAGERSEPQRFPKLYGIIVPAALAALVGIINIASATSPFAAIGPGLYLVILAGLGVTVASYLLRNSEGGFGENSLKIDNSMTHIYCRTCDNKVVARAVICTKCGCKPMDGNSYCYCCGAETNPNAVICISCGVALKKGSIAAAAVRNPATAGSPSGLPLNKELLEEVIRKPGFWAAVVILIAFFLPWLDFDFITISGWELRDLVRGIRMYEDENFKPSSFLNLMYFLPVLSILLITSFFVETPFLKKRIRSWKVLTGIYPLLFFIDIGFGSQNTIDFFAYGLYFTLAAGGLLLYDGIFGIGKKPFAGSSTNGAEDSQNPEITITTATRPSVQQGHVINPNESELATPLAETKAQSKPMSVEEQEVGYQLLLEQERNRRLRSRMIVFSSVGGLALLIVISFFAFSDSTAQENSTSDGAAPETPLIQSSSTTENAPEPSNGTGQEIFGAEIKIDDPASIPKEVAQAIISIKESQSGIGWDQERRELFNSSLEASLVDLDANNYKGLLVQGDPGANTTGFWLFANMGNQWKVILATRAHTLTIKNSSTNNVKDISVVTSTANTTYESAYRFNGSQYEVAECWEQQLTGSYTEKQQIPCVRDNNQSFSQPNQFMDLTNSDASQERTAILDAAKTSVQRELRQQVIFQVNSLQTMGEYAVLMGVPLNTEGNPLDYMNTRYAEQVREGAFEQMVAALCKRDGASWRCLEFKIGCTDPCYWEWYENYGVPKRLLGRND